MKLSDFHFKLPPSLIASHPVTPRDHSRLMVVSKSTDRLADRYFYELDSLLNPGDLLVLNNTKVFPARLFGYSGNRKFECFLLSSLDASHRSWSCLVKPGKHVKDDCPVQFSADISGTLCRTPSGFELHFDPSTPPFFDWIDGVGTIPLPPYIKRPADSQDKLRYQTLYAKHAGSIAAPTAGLHFTETLMERLKQKGIEFAEVTLHVGYGTFEPIRSENLKKHQMHEESFQINHTAGKAIQKAKTEGRRILPVGTTALRALESWTENSQWQTTSLFIRPGFRFRWAQGLITNFHLPQSSLIILVASLLGREKTLDCYNQAVARGYRFFSYGDAMMIW